MSGRFLLTALFVAFLLPSCVYNRHCASESKECGRLMLGKWSQQNAERDPMADVRWQLYSGLLLEGGGLVAGSIGGAHMILAAKRRDQAGSAKGVGEKALLLDKAEGSEYTAAWTLGTAAALVTSGAVMLIWDAVVQKKRKKAGVKEEETARVQDLLLDWHVGTIGQKPVAGGDGVTP